ncbi:hypothetical protein [Streptomyces netropsis]|uniref:Uncharacterized protein n=1 Tax=Streptomyces netropsis TaxID=55404 RepID=A0A7W7LIB8_STRNE|nr:hypothetical protein [Streptomyces netropsis]MBB4890437.1 hypothetical protein [Streptomyces netropsis]GGR45918.1 hypothetical protein GCM10010219_59400 [Streptomyces netropsis]
MSDIDFQRCLFAHLSRLLQQEGYGSKWPRDLSLAVGVVQALAGVLSRQEFENVVRAADCAAERMGRGPHPMLPNTLVSHLYDGRQAQFEGIPLPVIALAGHLLGVLHGPLSAAMFEDLLTALSDAVSAVTADERRERVVRTAGYQPRGVLNAG